MITHEIISSLKNNIIVNNLSSIQMKIISDGAPRKIIQGVRQSGKSYLLKSIALLNAFYNYDKTIYVTNINHMCSKSFLDDLKETYMSIPSHLKPGITRWDSRCVDFDNKSRIMVGIANRDSTCGLDIDLLLMDEVAFCNENNVCEFWDNNYPCLNNKEIIIASTRSSRSKRNFFWRTWLGAGIKNDFQKFKITNKDIPKRDSKWLREMKALMGKNRYYKEFIIKNS